MNIIDILEKRSIDTPNKVLFEFYNGSNNPQITYLQLTTKAKSFALHIQQKCSIGDRVLLWLPQDKSFVVSFFACLYFSLKIIQEIKVFF
jgi:acyl-CoA synthetase (AMP-forming)/AMP-acid ligase II